MSVVFCDRCGWSHLVRELAVPDHRCFDFARAEASRLEETRTVRVTDQVQAVFRSHGTGLVAVEGRIRARCTSWDATEAAARLLALPSSGETAPFPAPEAR
jgi:hypothetical protein